MALERARVAARQEVKKVVYEPVTLEPTERMIMGFAALVNKLPRQPVRLSAPGVKPVVYSKTETYTGLRRDRGNFTNYVYSFFMKEFKAGLIPESWTRLKPKGECTPEKPCSDCAHCALVACGELAVLNGLITMQNRTGSKGLKEDGRGYTVYYRLDEQVGVDEGLLDGIIAGI